MSPRPRPPARLCVGSENIDLGECAGACPAGRLRALAVEEQLPLTSIGRIPPYLLVTFTTL